MNIDIFFDRYLTNNTDKYDFDIYIISNIFSENYGTTIFSKNELHNIISKLKNISIEYTEFEEKRYKYFDMEYIIKKDLSKNNICENVVSNKYLLQDIYQSKLLVNIYTQSIIDRNLFPNLDIYHDEITSKTTKYKFSTVSVLINNINNFNNVHIMFSFNKQNEIKIKEDLKTIFSCFTNI